MDSLNASRGAQAEWPWLLREVLTAEYFRQRELGFCYAGEVFKDRDGDYPHTAVLPEKKAVKDLYHGCRLNSGGVFRIGEEPYWLAGVEVSFEVEAVPDGVHGAGHEPVNNQRTGRRAGDDGHVTAGPRQPVQVVEGEVQLVQFETVDHPEFVIQPVLQGRVFGVINAVAGSTAFTPPAESVLGFECRVVRWFTRGEMTEERNLFDTLGWG
ncbi:unnamed protein product [Gemmataceae bacterium]|nr:unnamed protein product [Gemmataceae bacterium]VTT97567.1 unnamed protein product [Gemmataceae bacterium]